MEGSKRSTHPRVRLAAPARGSSDCAPTTVEHAISESVRHARWISIQATRRRCLALEVDRQPFDTNARRAMRLPPRARGGPVWKQVVNGNRRNAGGSSAHSLSSQKVDRKT